MIITHKVKIDLERVGVLRQVDVVQGDQYSRDVELSLYAGENPWIIPEGVKLLMRFRKPDGHGGVYDALPDGSPAWKIDGNVATVAVAPQVCTVPGSTMFSVTFLQGQAELSTYMVLLNVTALPGGVFGSDDYVHITSFLPQPATAATVGQILKISRVDENGKVLEIVPTDPIDGEAYTGQTEVTPSLDTQILETEGKTLTQDITVEPIPYAEVANLSGGKTITIGG